MSTCDQSPWWRSFFEGVWLDVHPLLRSPARTEAECDFLDEVLDLNGAAKVLDVPCGNGRHAIELAARGCHVVGVDANPSVLDFARGRAEQRRVQVRWVRSDMREMVVESDFDLAINFWGSFGYFDSAGDRAFVEAVAGALRAGGRFFIDTQVAESILPNTQQRTWHEVGENTLLEDRRYEVLTGRMETVWTVLGPGEGRRTMESSIRLYSVFELITLLRSVGFVEFEALGNLSGDPFELGSPRLYLIARRGTKGQHG